MSNGVERHPSFGPGQAIALQVGRKCVRVFVEGDRFDEGGDEQEESSRVRGEERKQADVHAGIVGASNRPLPPEHNPERQLY